ncbi:MAG: hypothetical protein LBL74_03555 [Bacteroidales bacterium]|jgi:3-phosphoshikimate 1-carboxyvinyltransferase|nr:hypothetical protein [Bacteroidales bacterium]
MYEFIFSISDLPLDLRFNVPFSKSISNRILAINHLKSDFRKPLSDLNLSDCEDTKIIADSLETISRNDIGIFDCKNSGTAFRFLLCVAAITKGRWTLIGASRMADRQVKPLVDVLNNLGASIMIDDRSDKYVVLVKGRKSLRNTRPTISLPPLPSSQIISGLLLIADHIHNFNLSISENQASMPYINMTEALIANPCFDNETDWSCSAFAYCLMAVRKQGSVFIPLLKRSSLQGDSVCERLFESFGVCSEFTEAGVMLRYDPSIISKASIEIDVSDFPDLFLPLVVAAVCFEGITRFVGLTNIRFKESDRLSVAMKCLSELGISHNFDGEGLTIFANPHYAAPLSRLVVDSDDHRVVMSFAMLAFAHTEIIIAHPDCVNKSFPAFWSNFGIAL